MCIYICWHVQNILSRWAKQLISIVHSVLAWYTRKLFSGGRSSSTQSTLFINSKIEVMYEDPTLVLWNLYQIAWDFLSNFFFYEIICRILLIIWKNMGLCCRLYFHISFFLLLAQLPFPIRISNSPLRLYVFLFLCLILFLLWKTYL